MHTRILVPLAPGYGEEGRDSILVAKSLLNPRGTIDVLTVFQEIPNYLALQVIDRELAQENQREVEAAITGDFASTGIRTFFRSGHPTRTILDFATEGEHDCIVLASHQPGWGHFMLGSTASGVVRHATCSVHVLRRTSQRSAVS